MRQENIKHQINFAQSRKEKSQFMQNIMQIMPIIISY